MKEIMAIVKIKVRITLDEDSQDKNFKAYEYLSENLEDYFNDPIVFVDEWTIEEWKAE